MSYSAHIFLSYSCGAPICASRDELGLGGSEKTANYAAGEELLERFFDGHHKEANFVTKGLSKMKGMFGKTPKPKQPKTPEVDTSKYVDAAGRTGDVGFEKGTQSFAQSDDPWRTFYNRFKVHATGGDANQFGTPLSRVIRMARGRVPEKQMRDTTEQAASNNPFLDSLIGAGVLGGTGYMAFGAGQDQKPAYGYY